ncbi:MAG: hypothetical protein OEY85_11350, partial [Rhodospirillales bacterium]|nr:hypothetical protein [Rhodospirillales bacterium]
NRFLGLDILGKAKCRITRPKFSDADAFHSALCHNLKFSESRIKNEALFSFERLILHWDGLSPVQNRANGRSAGGMNEKKNVPPPIANPERIDAIRDDVFA